MPADKIKDSLTAKLWVVKNGEHDQLFLFPCKEAALNSCRQSLTIEPYEFFMEFITRDDKLYDALLSQAKENNLILINKSKKHRYYTYQCANFKVVFSNQCRGKMGAYVITITR